MTAWDIHPAGVQGVVSRTASAAHGLETGGQQLQNALQSASAAGQSAPVNDALGHVAAMLTQSLQGAASRTSRAITGTVNATRAYIDGDMQMAADAQAAASSAPEPAMPGLSGPR